MKITRTVLLISLSVLVTLPILNWSYQKMYGSAARAEANMWRKRFSEFSDALDGYNQRPDYVDVGNSENWNLFPSDFGILEKYGNIEWREYLKNAQDFRQFQRAVVIDINNHQYFDDMQLDLDSGLASRSVILHKDISSGDVKIRVVLLYDGTVFMRYPNSFAEPINRDYRWSWDGLPKK